MNVLSASLSKISITEEHEANILASSLLYKIIKMIIDIVLNFNK